ncbi:MAG: DUF2207 domain-containing protein [Clostridiales Family XIII bacterium]|jgi:uncharacterized membrane protein YgcG|nr:DUF2207 domain-containing protein [Clostridiales Family XIII bacterium]
MRRKCSFDHKALRVFAITVLLLAALLPAAAFATVDRHELARDGSASAEPTWEEENAGFVTDAFDVDVVVQRDNSFLVTETIAVDFLISSRGIYRDIPVKGKVYQQYGGQTIEMDGRMKIEDVSVSADGKSVPVSESTSGNNLSLRIGDPDVYLTGPVTYVISYRARLYDDEIDAYDLIYWNALPTEWQTPIRSARVTVTIPGADTDVSGAEFVAGAKGMALTDLFTMSTSVDAARDAVVVTGVSTGALATGYGVTFLLRLPEGYFSGEMSDAWIYRLLRILCVVPAAAALALWFLFGRDRRLVRPVEFYPPEGLPSGEIGYLVDGRVQPRDMLSMILWWASRGYLTIEETSKGQFTLTRRTVLPSGVKSYQSILFGALFGTRDEVALGSPSSSLATKLQQAQKALINDYKGDVTRNLYTRQSRVAAGVCYALACVPIVAFLACMAMVGSGSNVLGSVGSSSGGITFQWFYAVIWPVMLQGIWIGVTIALVGKRARGARSAGGGGKGAAIALSVVVFAVAIIVGFVTGDVADAVFVGVASVIASVCAVIALQRTEFYDGILDRILGFKDFIKAAEVDRMEKLFDQDPQYYFKTLPYAWVFGLSDIWAKKFEAMITEPPDWYRGYYGGASDFHTIYMIHSLGRLHTASIASFRPPASSGGGGGGGGFSGGGGSFSGGGGSSGGGFGGGGGGRW